ncbi:acyl carrier protein [Kitasatospora mediocidica]|uniref:acyl carrier protein n=1 Tax=Kitasatospora mediocidica TaxID=58352 RepID=UPI000568B826|nr:acyl carrier protein [Kitasatospora mediocidica]
MTVPGSVDLEQEIKSWLTERLSAHLSRPQSEINTEVPLVEYGLDSVAALSLFGDIEEKFVLYLEPAVAWEHPTVTAMAAFLAQEQAASSSGSAG